MNETSGSDWGEASPADIPTLRTERMDETPHLSTDANNIPDWGAASPADIPTLRTELLKHEMERHRFDKRFQLTILSVFLSFLAVLLFYDYSYVNGDSAGSSRFSEVLTIAVPIFTFLLGMGTQSVQQKSIS